MKELVKVGYKAENEKDNRVADSAKKADVHTASAPRKSIFTKKDDVASSPKPETTEKVTAKVRDHDDDKKVSKAKKHDDDVGKKKISKAEKKAFDKLTGIFSEFDKVIKNLDNKLNDIDEKMAEDESKGFGDFIDGLNKTFDDANRSEGNQFLKNLNKVKQTNSAADTHKLGMAEINKNTLDHLFNGGNEKSGFGINRIGDGGDGSGNFSATGFMSSIFDNINEGLDNYKDVKETKEEKESMEDKQMKTEADFNIFA